MMAGKLILNRGFQSPTKEKLYINMNLSSYWNENNNKNKSSEKKIDNKIDQNIMTPVNPDEK